MGTGSSKVVAGGPNGSSNPNTAAARMRRATVARKPKAVYKGERNKEGKKHGKGVITYPSGAIFEGEYDNDVRIRGKMTYSNKDVYEGEFKGDIRHGKGKIKTVNGDVYEGM